MKCVEFNIDGQLPDMNTIIDTAKIKKNKYSAYRKMKADNDFIVRTSCPNLKFKLKYAYFIHITWVTPDRRKEKDNIRAGMKFILDGLKGKLLVNDGYNNVGDFRDSWDIDKENPHINVRIYYREEDVSDE